MFFTKILTAVLNIIFPPLCLSCRRHLIADDPQPLCLQCFNSLEINNCFICPACARRLPQPLVICHPQAKFVLAAVGSYSNPALRETIHHFKYKGIRSALPLLKSWLTAYLKKIHQPLLETIEDGVIIPIPLHPRKERQRGFNQTKELAVLIEDFLKTAVNNHKFQTVDNVLIKTKNTAPQAKIEDFEQRKDNIKNSFEIRNQELIAGRNIILIDDVFTSGATIREAVGVLKKAGVRKIIALVLAKA